MSLNFATHFYSDCTAEFQTGKKCQDWQLSRNTWFPVKGFKIGQLWRHVTLSLLGWGDRTSLRHFQEKDKNPSTLTEKHKNPNSPNTPKKTEMSSFKDTWPASFYRPNNLLFVKKKQKTNGKITKLQNYKITKLQKDKKKHDPPGAFDNLQLTRGAWAIFKIKDYARPTLCNERSDLNLILDLTF